MTVPTLETERLILRPLSIDDLEQIFTRWASDPRVNKYVIYPLWKSPEDGREWIEGLYKEKDQLDFGFVWKESGELIGSGGLYYNDKRGLWTLGYNLAYDYWNRGLVTEAMIKIIEWARENYEVNEISGTFAVGNIGSQRVMEKLGLTYLEDYEYQKLDGSETFKAKTFHKIIQP